MLWHKHNSLVVHFYQFFEVTFYGGGLPLQFVVNGLTKTYGGHHA